MNGKGLKLTDEEARQILRRAAELQLRATDRESQEALPVPAEPTEGLEPTDLTSAAVEAGIAAEYVQQAMAELASGEMASGRGKGLQRYGRLVVGKPFDAIEAERTIPREPAEVYASLQRIFSAPPFGLVLTDSRGADPLLDGVLVFDVERSGFHGTQFQARLNFGDVSRLYVTLRAGPAPEGGCRIHIRAPFERRGLNVLLSSLFTAIPGTLGVTVGLGAGVAAALPVGLGLVGAGGGVMIYRGLYRGGVRKARRALDQLLGALAADVQLQLPDAANEFPPLKP